MRCSDNTIQDPDVLTYSTVKWHTIPPCNDIQYDAMTYNTSMQRNTVQCNGIQYDAIPFIFYVAEAGKLALKIAKQGETSDDGETILDQVRVWRSAWRRGEFPGEILLCGCFSFCINCLRTLAMNTNRPESEAIDPKSSRKKMVGKRKHNQEAIGNKTIFGTEELFHGWPGKSSSKRSSNIETEMLNWNLKIRRSMYI